MGGLVVITTAGGVSGVWWTGRDVVDLDRSSRAEVMLDRVVRELEEYFSGARSVFDVPIDRSERKGFRGEVLDALESVPFGETITYGDLAARSGRPNAARAVGTAMATNPVAIIVPCHRVLPSGGGIGGFGGGAAAKEWLLRREGSLG